MVLRKSKMLNFCPSKLVTLAIITGYHLDLEQVVYNTNYLEQDIVTFIYVIGAVFLLGTNKTYSEVSGAAASEDATAVTIANPRGNL